jgi:hypothetical protein
MVDWKQYENTPTLELIELIQHKEDQLHAEAAFWVFTFRFTKFLAKQCEILCYRMGYDHHFAGEVVKRVFSKFWQYPKYDHNKSKHKDVNKGVCLYLYSFIYKCIIDQINNLNGKGISPYSGDEQIIKDLPVDFKPKNHREEIIWNAVGTFSYKHKIIYLTYKAHSIQDHKLPRPLLAHLRDELGLSQNTIRYYYNEVMNKINEHLTLWERQN